MLCETEMVSGQAARELCLNEAIADDAERRQLHRKPFLHRATLRISDDPLTSMPAYCRDLSRDGIGLLHDDAIEDGTQYHVTIPLLGRKVEFSCQSSWCRQVAEGQYFSGGTYNVVSTPQALMLMSVALSQELNRRLHRRYPFVRPAQLEGPVGAKNTLYSRDISEQGIGFIHRHSVPQGPTTVLVRANDDTQVALDVDIRRCDVLSKSWYVSGARFLS